jgi:hypothetical protein
MAVVEAAMAVLDVDACAPWEAAVAGEVGATRLMTATPVTSTGIVTTRDHAVIGYRI